MTPVRWRFSLRWLLGILVPALAGALLIAPVETPAAVLLLGTALLGAVVLFLLIDYWLGLWVRRMVGRPVTPVQFLQSEAGTIAFVGGVVLALLLVYLGVRLPVAARVQDALLGGAALCAFLAVIAVGVELALRPAGAAHRLQPVADRLPVPPLGVQVREAFDFQRICGPRLVGALALLWGGFLGGWVLIAIPTAWLGVRLSGWSGPLAALGTPDWPLPARLAGLFLLVSGSWVTATVFLTTFRVVQRVRRVGRLKEKVLGREFGLALETVGPLGSIGWGLSMMALLAIVAGVGAVAGSIAAGMVGAVVAWTLGVGTALALFWFAVVLPQTYTFPVLTRRDCGWLRAVEASVELLRIEGRTGVAKSLLAFLLFLTGVGIPAAVALLQGALDRRELLLAAILGEKSSRELQDALHREERHLPDALRKYFDLLERGRYLDALNGFQMWLHKHGGEDVTALRGTSLAMLFMGNRRAREFVERWQSLDPQDAEPARLLQEIADGLWKDDGRLFLEAQRRCTQPVGQGV